MTLMEKEILSQPEAVRHAAEANADCIRAFVAAAKARGFSRNEIYRAGLFLRPLRNE